MGLGLTPGPLGGVRLGWVRVGWGMLRLGQSLWIGIGYGVG